VHVTHTGPAHNTPKIAVTRILMGENQCKTGKKLKKNCLKKLEKNRRLKKQQQQPSYTNGCEEIMDFS